MTIKSAYWGSVALWESIALSEGVQIEAFENFQKQTFRSRTKIITAGGVRTLSVPTVHKSGQKIAIRDVLIDYTMAWQREELRTIATAYAAAPYYHHFIDRVAPVLAARHKYLFDLNLSTFELVASILKLDMAPTLTTQFLNSAPVIVEPAESYYQVFSDRLPFAANLSILDAIFCVGRLPSEE